MILKPRHRRTYKQWREVGNHISVALQMVKYHDDCIASRWHWRKLSRMGLLDGTHIRVLLRDGTTFDIKGSARSYGSKWVRWEPFTIYTHFSEWLNASVMALEVISKGSGKTLIA